MEEYENFRTSRLARIQNELVKNEPLQSIPQKGISVIRFHGIAVMSPLMGAERKREMQQYRQKAMELELSWENTRKSALLNRVQEIIENVQVRKVPSTVCVKDPVDLEKTDATNGLTTVHHTDYFSALETQSSKQESPMLSNKTELMLNDTIANASEQSEFLKSTQSIKSDNAVYTKSFSSNGTNIGLSTNVSAKKDELKIDDLPPGKEPPDHYAMSLQNLLRKSREYVEREQHRRTGKNASKEGTNESHSDKENQGVKINDWERESIRVSNRSRSSSPVIVEKSTSLKSASQMQVPSITNESFELHNKMTVNTTTSTLCVSPKIDFPVRSITAFSQESDEEWINSSAYEHESSLFKSLIGSHAKLPNPAPSRSPKMHQRHSRTLANIVINHPVNAYELSPKEKLRGITGTDQGIKDLNVLEIRKAFPNEILPSVNQEAIESSCAKPQDLSEGTVKAFDVQSEGNPQCMYAEPFGKFEVNMISNLNPIPLRNQIYRESFNLDSTSLLVAKQKIQLLEPQIELDVSNQKSNTVIEKPKQRLPVDLNKSYDVESPSPVLLQSQNIKRQMDLSVLSSGSENNLENSKETKAKRKLDLDVSKVKENKPFVAMTMGSNSQEKNLWIQEEKRQRDHLGSNKPERSLKSQINGADEGLISKQMKAFEEMRKRLEQQHTLQLSLLIAEQEKEQEKLRQEIEEKERLFRESKDFVADSQGNYFNKESSFDWKRISENCSMESRTNRVDGVINNSAMQSSSLTMPGAESVFYRRGTMTAEISEIQAPSFLIRSKPGWSQINTPRFQQMFDKVTALAKGFLTRKLLETEKLKQLRQTVKDTLEFMNNFQTEGPLKRSTVSSQDVSLQERVFAQLRAALYEIHDIFIVLNPTERMQILQHDREIRKEKQLRQMEKRKSPKERVSLSAATQKSLDRKRQLKAAEMGIINKRKLQARQKVSSQIRILQPSQGQNAPTQRPLHRQGTQPSRKGVEQNRERFTESRFPRKALPGKLSC
uniref:Centriolar coiled-coil protein 110 n=1 Tax=Callorhinchus milii TaxID=7868 RepID=A0A4W3I2Q6_CALMI|eukprot:gi/632952592/ref/XP_007891935.1/ PREDICTED: centriolar coiled-coil protein of 110 kDa [Callorhinchus milii]